MLHPNQFTLGETWIAFMLSDRPIRTRQDGDFNCVGLMDAASCFLLSNTLTPVGKAEPSKAEVKSMFKMAMAPKKQLPKTLMIPSGQFQRVLPAEAERLGIEVVRVPEEQLLVFISEARDFFNEYMGGRRDK